MIVVGLSANGNRPDGKKKAYIRLQPTVDALDIANRVSLL